MSGVALSLFLVTNITSAQQGPPPLSSPASGPVLVQPGGTSSPMTSVRRSRDQESRQLHSDAATALRAGNFADAEELAREALSVVPVDADAQGILAVSLDAQGKTQEALDQYQIVAEHYDTNARSLLPYALLLLKSGQWERALAMYNQAISRFGRGLFMPEKTRFSPDVPEPTALALALHIDLGRLYSSDGGWPTQPEDTAAMSEYAKALQLAPNSSVANYYYGYGWQKLSPAERKAAKPGQREAVKAALEKAAKLGTGDVQTQAKAELKQLR